MVFLRRTSSIRREDVIKIGLTYPEGLKMGSFVKADAPFSPDSYRENGDVTAGQRSHEFPLM